MPDGVAAAASGRRPKLFLLTRNAQPLAEGDRANPAHAVLWGLGRTLALEHPEIWGAVVDVNSFGKKGYVPGRFLTKDKTARLTKANDPARGLIYCQRCDTNRQPIIGKNCQTGAQRYVCGECMSIKIDMIPGKEPTGDYAII